MPIFTTRSLEVNNCNVDFNNSNIDFKISTVMPGLHIGSQDAVYNINELNEKGITHILNVAHGLNIINQDKFEQLAVDILDEPDVDIICVFSKCFDFIDKARKNNGGVLVHWYFTL